MPKVEPTDIAAMKILRLWRNVAQHAESQAVKSLCPDDVQAWAKLAEAAWWQTTGEEDCVTINSLKKEHGA